MVTNRRQRRRSSRPPSFTPAALEAFRKLHALEDQCTCPERDWNGEYWKHQQCAACDAWWEQFGIIHDELRLQPWDFAVQHPDATSGYPEGCQADKNWKPDLEAQARYRALAAACGISLE
jgi:hypothetical protein